jgi:hypothetical protein
MLEPTAEQYRRIRRAIVMLVVGSADKTRAIPASARWGEKPPRFDLAAFCSR